MKIAAVLFTGILLALPGSAQKLDLKFDELAAKASEKAEVDLDGALLKFALRAAEKEDKKVSTGLLSGVQRVYVRHYEFDKAGAWTDKDFESLRKQVNGVAGWSRIVNVKEKDEISEVYVQIQGSNLGGALILAAEEKEFTVVHIEGTITLAQVREMMDSHIAFNLSGVDLPGVLGKRESR